MLKINCIFLKMLMDIIFQTFYIVDKDLKQKRCLPTKNKTIHGVNFIKKRLMGTLYLGSHLGNCHLTTEAWSTAKKLC